MIVRRVTGAAHDERKRIVALFGAGDWSPVSTKEATAAMRAGLVTYISTTPYGDARIHPYQGTWVRTEATTSQAENLDVLALSEAKALATGSFSAVLTMSPAGIVALARELHSSGGIANSATLEAGGWLVSVSLGVPSFRAGDDDSRFVITREALCVARVSHDASAPAFSAVAELTVECEAALKVRRGSTLDVTLRYKPRAVDPVRVLTPLTPDKSLALKQALTAFATRSRVDAWSVPLTGLLQGVVGADARLAPSGHAQVGVDTQSRGARTFPDARSPWDWTLALSRPVVSERLGEALRTALGALPAPMGSDRRVPVPGTADVYLRSLELGLGGGQAILRGTAYKAVSPVVTANFSVRLGVSLNAAQELEVSVLGTDVEVVEWYAKVADLLSGGAITDAVARGLAAATGAVSGSGLRILDDDVLSRIVAAGTTQRTAVHAEPRQVWIEEGAVLMGGVLSRVATAPDVVAVALGDRIDATLTTTPGANPVEVTWDVDGVVHRGLFEARALSFNAGTGWRDATVTVTTDEGLSSTTHVTHP